MKKDHSWLCQKSEIVSLVCLLAMHRDSPLLCVALSRRVLSVVLSRVWLITKEKEHSLLCRGAEYARTRSSTTSQPQRLARRHHRLRGMHFML